jgi:RNA polymerase sigma-70 factor, ECF subfamily
MLAPAAVNHVSGQTYKSPKDPDASLVNALRARSVTAFDNLLERHERRLQSVAEKITMNREDAEDVVQDSFLKVFKHLDSFRGDSQFSSWLTRITINQALMKKRGQRPKFVSLDELLGFEDYAGVRELTARGYTPEQVCSQREFASVVFGFSASMRKSSRQVWQLHAERELSESEIAKVTGLTLSAVKSRLYRARQELRRKMERHLPSAIPANAVV